MTERDYWLGFSAFSGIGPMKFRKLLMQFGSAKDAWEAPRPRFAKLMGEKLAEKFEGFRNKFSISDYATRLQRLGVSFLTLKDESYPQLLRQIKNPPFLLYVKGDATVFYSSGDQASPESREVLSEDGSRQALNRNGSGQARTVIPTIAVVGTRKTTQYGREVTALLTQELVANGFTIVSGLAMGIDAISHKTAIENNGKTIAVLGCGVDCCYPIENQNLYNSIISGNGCVVSEYPLDQLPTKGSFPSRNRIIAGLSMGVLVTEGAQDSGALITADYAIKFDRPVFAVPGPITSSLSKGPYKLISHGAKLVTTANDILKELKIQNSKVKTISRSEIWLRQTTQNSKLKGGTKEEQKILDLLQNEPLSFDDLVRRTGFDSSKTGSLLSIMEIKGFIKALENGVFSIAS